MPATPLQAGLKGVQPRKKAYRLGIWLVGCGEVPRETDRQGGREGDRSLGGTHFEALPWGLNKQGRNALGFGALVEEAEICDRKLWAATQGPDWISFPFWA